MRAGGEADASRQGRDKMKSHNKTSLTRFCAAVCKIMGASVPRCADAPLVGQIFGRI